MLSQLEDQFHTAMLQIYESGIRLKPPYRATYFLQMVHERGGKATADQLLASPNPSSGFTELYLRGRESLKLSVEYLVLDPRWKTLFTDAQLATARERLAKVGCDIPE